MKSKCNLNVGVAFVDKDNRILYIMNNAPKGKISPFIRKAKYVIEASAGQYESKGLEVGDVVEMQVTKL